MSSLPLLRILLVNWNSGDQLRACLRSVAQVARHDTFRFEQVVVVDNASSDGSADDPETTFASGPAAIPLRVLRNETNRGFAAACNQGAEGSEADYLLLLNPDTVAYPDSFDAPIAFLERPENRRIGILGIRLLDENGQVSRRCARFPTPRLLIGRSFGADVLLPSRFPSQFMKEWDHEDSREVDQVMGAYFLVRRQVWEEIGGMDERFFVYFEDVDFALRAKRAGWVSYYWNGASIFHKGGGTTERVKAVRLAYSLFGRIQYARKHFSPWGATGVLLAVLLGDSATRLGRALLRRSPAEAAETLRAFVLLARGLRRGTILPGKG
ncbi:MAG: glycosyltransferase family 2 protein [Capsulimonadales bacterium]|nr:glycosyltransferase family 2 protein [Capsulimonadales bacterium]